LASSERNPVIPEYWSYHFREDKIAHLTLKIKFLTVWEADETENEQENTLTFIKPVDIGAQLI
ncbi:MAG: hypothetical protein QGG38_09665, partial [Nitrospinaceae bacterium]|nr:hypothetical protein [Nitrospinaceae bacterium]